MNHLEDEHYRVPGGHAQSMTTRQLRETLLETKGYVFACGERYDVKSKSLGVGVFLVWLEKRP